MWSVFKNFVAIPNVKKKTLKFYECRINYAHPSVLMTFLSTILYDLKISCIRYELHVTYLDTLITRCITVYISYLNRIRTLIQPTRPIFNNHINNMGWTYCEYHNV